MKKEYYRIHLRMSEKQYKSLKAQSRAAGMTMNKFLMKRLTDTQPFYFPCDKIRELAALTNEAGKRINEIARNFNSGFGAKDQLTEAVNLMIDIVKKTYALAMEKQAAEDAWVEAYDYKKPRPRGWFVSSEKQICGLMIRMDEEHHALFRKYLSMTRYSRKLFLQRLISGIPLDLNRRERLEAYGGFGPCNRIDNNIRQIMLHPDARKKNEWELEQLGLLNSKLLEYAAKIVDFKPLAETLEVT